MACDTRTLPGQTFAERKVEVKKAIDKLAQLIATERVKPVIDRRTGGITFPGWADSDRGRVSDGCALRLLPLTGSAKVIAAIQKAELLAGRPVNRQAVAQGLHSHDGGATWHKH